MLLADLANILRAIISQWDEFQQPGGGIEHFGAMNLTDIAKDYAVFKDQLDNLQSLQSLCGIYFSQIVSPSHLIVQLGP